MSNECKELVLEFVFRIFFFFFFTNKITLAAQQIKLPPHSFRVPSSIPSSSEFFPCLCGFHLDFLQFPPKNTPIVGLAF